MNKFLSAGAIIQTGALVTALKEGEIGGAGLDVTHPEPLPCNHPLRTMSNVIITPHMAYGVKEVRLTSFFKQIVT